MLRSILVPLDGSPFGERALPLACSIAARAGSRLVLAHVHVAAAPLVTDALPGFDDLLDNEQRMSEQAYLTEIAARVAAPGVAVTTTVLDDPVVTALHGYALDNSVDLIVMTTHGRGAISRFWLGSVADTLVRRTTLPVLLERPRELARRPDQQRAIQRILIPLDGSALAEQIIPCATELGALSDAEYLLVQAVEPAMARHVGGNGSHPSPEHDQQTFAQARQYLEGIARRMRLGGLRVRTDVLLGPAGASILDAAHTQAVDLIAMETHGRGGITRLLLGSIADWVLRGTLVPVLLHRPS
ncbi:MAG: hypothetical protein RLZZ387_4449 [Chloroflexota bacterium]|jgi:nucleotide-binding universal stress UspA family protein